MPYIDKETRYRFDKMIGNLGGGCLVDDRGCCPGDLNYIITKILMNYVNSKGESYTHYNDVIGVLSCVSQELYRRKIVPYEDIKIVKNGDLDVF